MGVCSVLGCQSRSYQSTGEGKHLFRFPRENQNNQKIINAWIKFTKRKNLIIKESSSICELHFAPDCFVTKKKGRLYLVKDSVPTIYIQEQKNKHFDKIEIPFDPNTQEYLNEEIFNYNPHQLDLIEQENQLLHERDIKVLEAKNLCRFCIEKGIDIKCVPINKLEAYSLDSVEILSMLDAGTQYAELFSEIICEKCFHTLLEFDNFKKKCKRLQNEFVQEINEIDQKLDEIRNSQKEQQENSSWFKVELLDEITNEEIIESEEVEPNYDLIEEHLEDDDYEDDTYDAESFSDYQIKDENLIDQLNDDYEEMSEEKQQGEKIETDDIFDYKDKYEEVLDKEVVIKNPDRNSVAYRIYECFFCRVKFAGRKTFKAHDCPVKEITCQAEGCDKTFKKQSGYNQHIVKVHGHLQLSKHFCPLCKQFLVASITQFKQHCKQCNKAFNNKEQIIECEICKKQCKSLKSYTVHRMFHDARNLVKMKTTYENCPKNQALFSPSKGPVICELCGRSFTNGQGLRTHKKNVHLIGSKGEIYQCDICSKMRPTKRSLFNHMRNVHRKQETPCTVCGKVFRTKALLQKHMMYHDESKRIHFCSRCPERPGYFTAVALRRHQKSHHIGMKEYICDFGNCESSYTSSHMLKQHQRQCHGAQ